MHMLVFLRCERLITSLSSLSCIHVLRSASTSIFRHHRQGLQLSLNSAAICVAIGPSLRHSGQSAWTIVLSNIVSCAVRVALRLLEEFSDWNVFCCCWSFSIFFIHGALALCVSDTGHHSTTAITPKHRCCNHMVVSVVTMRTFGIGTRLRWGTAATTTGLTKTTIRCSNIEANVPNTVIVRFRVA